MGWDAKTGRPYVSAQGDDLAAVYGHLYRAGMAVNEPFTKLELELLPARSPGHYWGRLYATIDDSDCFKGGPLWREKEIRVWRELSTHAYR
jgi:hypothetical protein